MRAASEAHHEEWGDSPDENWPRWYATWINENYTSMDDYLSRRDDDAYMSGQDEYTCEEYHCDENHDDIWTNAWDEATDAARFKYVRK